ncbi:YfjI family protein [Winogradskyella sp.]|nr:YfjI family protein [Winogradskyella sp.]
MENKNQHNPGLALLSDAIDAAMNSNNVEGQNTFPIDVFPKMFRDLAIGLKTSLKFPIDYTGTGILAAISATIGTTAKVKVKNNWLEYGSIYTCLIGNAGANKSHPLSTVFKPLKDLDKITNDEYIHKMKAHLAYSNLSAKKREEREEVPEPTLKKMVLTNFTPEVLNKRLNDNPRGCVVLSDELASFFEGMNNYSKNDHSSNYLSFWSNQPTTIDRVGKKIPLMIETPYLSIIGGVQPRVLNKVFKPQQLDSGFFQRFLFAFPKHAQKEAINDEELNPKLMLDYSNFINTYINYTSSIELKSRVLEWTIDAKRYFYDWQANNCQLVNENSGNIVSEIITKFDNHFIRLALIVQIMSDPKSLKITFESVKASEKLCDYFMKCALDTLSTIQNSKSHHDSLNETKKLLYDAISNEFTTAEALALGENYGLKERRVKEFLNDSVLFTRVKHGHYRKNMKSEKTN